MAKSVIDEVATSSQTLVIFILVLIVFILECFSLIKICDLHNELIGRKAMSKPTHPYDVSLEADGLWYVCDTRKDSGPYPTVGRGYGTEKEAREAMEAMRP